ncbi:MAG: ankyrin repeat domain-containing protein [Candidatus Amoebophilus sp.]
MSEDHIVNKKTDVSGDSPLHIAVLMGDIEEVKSLLEHGADVHAQNKNGSTPLHVAAWFNKLEVAKFLLEQGADIHVTNAYGQTPLHLAEIQLKRAIEELEEASIVKMLKGE